MDTRKLRLKSPAMGTKTYAILDYNTFGVLARTTDRTDQQDFAAELVKRYNTHTALVEALKETLRVLVTPTGFPDARHRTPEQQAAYAQARAALEAAK